MTSEETFIKIENALRTVSEYQAQHEVAIRDLIIVSRTLLESQKETTNQIHELTADQRELTASHRELRDEFDRKMAEWAELSADTEQKLNALIETVDRIIGRKNGQS